MSVKDQLRGFWPVTCTRAEDETKSSRGSSASSIQRFRIVELPTFVTVREYRIVSPGRPTSGAAVKSIWIWGARNRIEAFAVAAGRKFPFASV